MDASRRTQIKNDRSEHVLVENPVRVISVAVNVVVVERCIYILVTSFLLFK